MYYELRRYDDYEITGNYTTIFSGTLEQIAGFIYENGWEEYLNFSGVKLYALSESEVNKSLLVVEVARIEKENN